MNAALQRLGYDEHDRVLIIHADDIGMCQSSVSGLAELFGFGLLSSAAVMVPCPWFQAAADLARAHPAWDLGVHLTLNSEWDLYRWAPLSTRDPASGLLDEQGYFHHRPPATEQQAELAAVRAELAAQVRQARAAGLDPTHLDAHMLTAAKPRFRALYASLALEQRLPLLLTYERPGLSALAAAMAVEPELAERMDAQGVPFFDDLLALPLDEPGDQVALAKKMIDALRPGLTMLILHPAQDTPELRAMAPDWASRVANAAAMLNAELRDHLRQSGVQVIGYRPLRGLLKANS